MVTGGQDAIINVYALESGRTEPIYTLLGHSDNICSLRATQDGVIISGSWDKYVPFLSLNRLVNWFISNIDAQIFLFYIYLFFQL